MLQLDALTPRGLEPVTIDIADGDCVAVTGPSGAGKTIFLRAIADLDENGGDVCADGLRRSATPAPDWRKRVTYVPTDSGWWADTVSDHLAGHDQCPDLLNALGLPPESLAWPVARLSTGEKQRLALIRALLGEPSVLLLDEPTAALDHDSAAAVESVLADYLKRGRTMVIVTHDAAQADRLGARRAVIDNGRLSVISQAAP